MGVIVSRDIAQHFANCDVSPKKPPTSDHSQKVEEFYSQIEDLIKKLPKKELTILMADFNAKVDKGREEKHIGPYRLGVRSERGQMLSIIASKHVLVIMNTFYKLPGRRLYTWMSPRDVRENHIIPNDIDVLANQKKF